MLTHGQSPFQNQNRNIYSRINNKDDGMNYHCQLGIRGATILSQPLGPLQIGRGGGGVQTPPFCSSKLLPYLFVVSTCLCGVFFFFLLACLLACLSIKAAERWGKGIPLRRRMESWHNFFFRIQEKKVLEYTHPPPQVNLFQDWQDWHGITAFNFFEKGKKRGKVLDPPPPPPPLPHMHTHTHTHTFFRADDRGISVGIQLFKQKK